MVGPQRRCRDGETSWTTSRQLRRCRPRRPGQVANVYKVSLSRSYIDSQSFILFSLHPIRSHLSFSSHQHQHNRQHHHHPILLLHLAVARLSIGFGQVTLSPTTAPANSNFLVGRWHSSSLLPPLPPPSPPHHWPPSHRHRFGYPVPLHHPLSHTS